MEYAAPASYKGQGTYSDLTEAESATWNEYTNLRQVSDWPGFDQAQNDRKTASRLWIIDRMDYLAQLATGKVEGETKGWGTASRGKRYDYLFGLNSGEPKHEVRLPCPGSATDREKVYIEEREVYLVFASTYDEQTTRKLDNVSWLVDARKRLYSLMQDDPSGNRPNDRQARYDALCVATHWGDAYKEWDETHNKYGEPYAKPSQREDVMEWCQARMGISENPAGTNKGRPQPSGWEDRVYGDDGVPWCACFAVCSAWDASVEGVGTAGCALNTTLATRGQGIYRGYTTDPSRVREGDHFFVGSSHMGIVRSNSCTTSKVPTYEGNTSPGLEGSQYNGGTTAKKERAMVSAGGPVTGFGLVRFND